MNSTYLALLLSAVKTLLRNPVGPSAARALSAAMLPRITSEQREVRRNIKASFGERATKPRRRGTPKPADRHFGCGNHSILTRLFGRRENGRIFHKRYACA